MNNLLRNVLIRRSIYTFDPRPLRDDELMDEKVRQQLADITRDAVRRNQEGTADRDENNIAALYACFQDGKQRETVQLGQLAAALHQVEQAATVQEYADTMPLTAAGHSTMSRAGSAAGGPGRTGRPLAGGRIRSCVFMSIIVFPMAAGRMDS